ncbi:MAG: hypothetical protein A2506_07280 [Elusimicrobia bacterium RIFOXYD12_FULL_66_9]|nr:MAG: hypothetical protein A2506_07280 [Elusimicrobia bacterium RIFOXYD12_FULL_66_9]
MNRFAAVALLAAMTASGCATGPKGIPTRSLVVEGWAPLRNESRPEARRQAVADAQRKAVEEAAGVEIAAISLVDDAAMSRQRLSSTSRGSVRSFKVLSERAEDGMLKVRLRAVVEMPGKDDVRKPGWAPGTGPKAYIEASIDETTSAQAEAQGAFIRAWTSYGGEVASSRGSADLILRSSVETHEVDEPRVRPYVSARARFSLSASQAGASGGTQWAVAREAASLGLDARDAGSRAVEAAAAAAAEAAAKELPSHLWLSARASK